MDPTTVESLGSVDADLVDYPGSANSTGSTGTDAAATADDAPSNSLIAVPEPPTVFLALASLLLSFWFYNWRR